MRTAVSKHGSVHIKHTHMTSGTVTGGTTSPGHLRLSADIRQGLAMKQTGTGIYKLSGPP